MCDKVPEYGSIDVEDMYDDFMYMQEPSGTGKETMVGKTTDISAVVALLQAIFAILLVIGKTLHEQLLIIPRKSNLSQPSLLSHFQPEASLSSSSSCPCKTQPMVCCVVTTACIGKVSSMVSVTSTCVTGLRQMWDRLTADIATTLYQVGCEIFDVLVPETEFERVNKK